MARKHPEFSKRPDGKNDCGAPKFKFDYDMVEKLGQIMCTKAEIAAFFGVCEKTVYNDKEFGEAHKRGMEMGKMSLRRKQMELVNNGNATMSIWLGKQYLGQTDKQELKHEGDLVTQINVLPASQKNKEAD